MDILNVLSVRTVDRYRSGLDKFSFAILFVSVTGENETSYRNLTSHGKDRMSWREP